MAELDNNTQNNEGKFTQAQLETKIGERLSRERKSIATKLGIESMDKLDGFLENNKSNLDLREKFQRENIVLGEKNSDTELVVDMLKANIDPDQLDNAKALTQVKLSKDDTLDFKTGLEKLVEEMPFLIRGTEQQKIDPEKVKVGVEVKNVADTRTEKDKHDEKYKNSIYYRK